MPQRLQVGIDFSQKRADICCLYPDGRFVEAHRPFANSWPGYEQTRDFLLELLARHQFDGLDISGEATGYYWLPFFQQLASDPALAPYDPDLFLLNPRWVKWFKKCFAQDDKSDQKDPFYIAERTRTRRPEHPWQALDTLPVRFYTRYRFHLALDLTREKNYFTALLFLKASSYARRKPFADVFGVTSRLILSSQTNLADLAALSADALADFLDDLSQHHLPDPADNARKLQLAITESFPLDPSLAQPVQDCLDFGLAYLRFLEDQIAQVEAKIAAAVQSYPAIAQLRTIPGVGPVYSAGIGVEIGATDRFLHGHKWDKRRQAYRPRTLRDAEDAVAKLAGLWWPKNDSGDFVAQDRHLAKSGNRYLRYYLIQAADKMRQHIPEYAQFYQRKYQEVSKHQHKRALVLTARKSVGLFVGLLHRNEAYRSKEVTA
jgi:transposase